MLSPASCAGRRAQILFRDGAAFPLAVQIRNGGAALGEVFTFLSGLYFRGKVAYANAFAQAPAGAPSALVITSSRGLMALDAIVGLSEMEEFAGVPIGSDSRAFRAALQRTARALHDAITPETLVVLLGSIATGKYTETLRETFADRLRFPAEFVGRGDMSRGGLMLRCAEDARELEYVPVDGRPLHGARPPRLEPRPRARAGR